jgi:hypothetical protein
VRLALLLSIELLFLLLPFLVSILVVGGLLFRGRSSKQKHLRQDDIVTPGL